jgi:hypothetical protein
MKVCNASAKEGREQKGKGRREKAKKESKGLLRFEMSTHSHAAVDMWNTPRVYATLV